MTASFSVEPDAAAVAETAADVVAGVVRERPAAVIGFATGSSPLRLYAALASRVRRGDLDLTRTTAVAVDEYVGTAPDDPRSFAAYLRHNVLEPLGIPRTRAVLAEETRAANAGAFAPIPVPVASITIGLASIAQARTILLVATGDDKADAVAAAFDGPVDPSCPGSLLQRHPDVRAVLDPTAASSLSRRGRGAPTVLEKHA
jgi:glucosamine-6-phosphate deaminase